jgi:hypothetical protein
VHPNPDHPPAYAVEYLLELPLLSIGVSRPNYLAVALAKKKRLLVEQTWTLIENQEDCRYQVEKVDCEAGGFEVEMETESAAYCRGAFVEWILGAGVDWSVFEAFWI